MTDYAYTGWRRADDLDAWPTIRMIETATGPRRCCCGCGGPAAHLILDGAIFLCAAGVAERRSDRARYRAAVQAEQIGGNATGAL